MAQITLPEGAAASTPSTGIVTIYAKTDGLLYSKDDAGTETALGVSGGGVADGDKGDVTVSSSGTVWTVDNDVVTNAKLANMATATFKGRTTAGTGDPEDLTVTQATALLNAVVGDSGSGGTKGLVPAPAPGDAAAGKFLKADGTWAAPSGGGGVSDGDKGDITVSASGTTWTIDNDAVTYAKIQNVSATDKLLGRSTAGAGDVEEITCTAAGRALLDDADASAQRTTLGLAIGTDVQAFDADTAKTGAAQNWTGTPRATPTTDNDLSFSMNAALDFNCTPTAGGALTFTNITQGQRGSIYLVNGSNYAITAGTGTKVTSTLLATISATGEYWLSYWSPDGTIVLVTAAGDFA